ncbi:MAG: histidine kinase [Bdellovibrionales bacterium RIFCSPHIGHO2_01_FULL_40_29]|nr:MAG: histidine kinase [Bdellovibrionales bacterium RIFCSPHIGHO2_01_FULL_40_29]OFZ32737.1 MAG: histidine kinase [Bdellovibrionales bacterium RIFCSPHIGHO2_02_FULL_40_15]
MCWIISLFFLKVDEGGSYDNRFRLRGQQKISNAIVLVTVKTSDFSKIYDLKTNSLINTNELSDLSDSFYWERSLWQKLLSEILKQNPRSVGVTLYFGDNVGQIRFSTEEIITFKDKRVFWATNSSQLEKLSLPIATRPDRSNLGHIDILKDDDGVSRRLFINPDYLPNLAFRLTQEIRTEKYKNKIPIINFTKSKQFKTISYLDIINGKIPSNFLKGKIVLIGTEKSAYSQIQTPMGLMSRHEYWGQVVENLLQNNFIKKLPFWLYATFLLILALFAMAIISSYPQAAALFFFLWLVTLTAAFSAWVFDSFAIWIPIISPISLFIFIWLLFTAYQALRIEKAHMRLKQEQSYFSELEQLKNNFVSLISHDLKTPIAKIQAVLDRLLSSGTVPPEISEDLNSLKDYSEELNRYIQSILKVLRVESRDFKIMKETADINGVIENVVERLKPLAASKSIQIQVNLEPMFLIEFDVTLMTEVFLNIIENSIKYTPENGLIRIRSHETETDVFIEITDTGEGISPEDQENVWKKFVRGKAQDHKTKGTGLGLFLVKYFIELHGGKISLKSELKKGTTIFVSLPLSFDNE